MEEARLRLEERRLALEERKLSLEERRLSLEEKKLDIQEKEHGLNIERYATYLRKLVGILPTVAVAADEAAEDGENMNNNKI